MTTMSSLVLIAAALFLVIGTDNTAVQPRIVLRVKRSLVTIEAIHQAHEWGGQLSNAGRVASLYLPAIITGSVLLLEFTL